MTAPHTVQGPGVTIRLFAEKDLPEVGFHAETADRLSTEARE
jgi:hypothetical protein